MAFGRIGVIACVALGMLGAGAARAVEPSAPVPVFKAGPKGGSYDSLMLALSWVPTFCGAPGAKADREQCAGTVKYGFAAHGLWPQFPRGSGASRGCTGEVTALTDKAILPVQGIIPSHRLMAHEWDKHGTCFGTDAATYFAKTRQAWDKIKIPARFKSVGQDTTVSVAQIRAAFVEANPGLSPLAVAVSCRKVKSKGASAPDPRLFVSDVRICFDKSLNFAACGKQIHDHCKVDGVLPAIK